MAPSFSWLVVLALQGVGVARAQPATEAADPSHAATAEAEPAADEASPVQRPSAEATNEEPTNEDAPAGPDSKAEPTNEEPTNEAAPTEPDPSTDPTTEVAPSPAPAQGTEAASPAPAPAPAPTPAPAPAKSAAILPARTHPRLVLAGGPVVGPHALGNEECDPELARCETKGSFFGVGGQLELRGRLWRFVYLHARGVAVGNVSTNDRIFRGLWGAGVGLGLYGRRVFGRGEYLYVDAFGDNHFEPPFFDGEVATDEWGHHAGMLSVGFRQPLPRGLAAELWGGLVIGPHSVRRVPQVEPDERVLTTFLLGLNLSWDAWP